MKPALGMHWMQQMAQIGPGTLLANGKACGRAQRRVTTWLEAGKQAVHAAERWDVCKDGGNALDATGPYCCPRSPALRAGPHAGRGTHACFVEAQALALAQKQHLGLLNHALAARQAQSEDTLLDDADRVLLLAGRDAALLRQAEQLALGLEANEAGRLLARGVAADAGRIDAPVCSKRGPGCRVAGWVLG